MIDESKGIVRLVCFLSQKGLYFKRVFVIRGSDCLGKAQISIEYLTLTAIILLVVGVMFGFASITVNENTRFNSAYYATRELANAADEVSTRNGSTIVVEVELPSDVTGFYAFGKDVVIEITSPANTYEIYESSKANLEPTTFSTEEGSHFIAVKSTDTNVTFTEI
ncbi:MAG: hypothetical protein COX63_01320 [Candidatus Diapherotrites archaeon CG_4_10_14_0_2_um_filter_31_5]|nr:MAG: hypothetical protein COX63_01320 [Candidatus Diapherotrites archaeon CG_4_10_14_0_2_um_filter_31_5]